MFRAINRANRRDRLDRLLAESSVQSSGRPCVFLSHQKDDTAATEKIAEYLLQAGVDVYFDKYDKTLSQLVAEGNPDGVTARLQKGIDESTHMLCVVSSSTVKSYWVPFEVGYGYRHTKLGVLTLRGVAESDLPDYMRTTKVIRGTRTLNAFIAELAGQQVGILEANRLVKSHTMTQHPLDTVLDWNQ